MPVLSPGNRCFTSHLQSAPGFVPGAFLCHPVAVYFGTAEIAEKRGFGGIKALQTAIEL